MSLEITKAGFLALIQDHGRYGLQKYGITTGGPADEHAYLWANRLLGNTFNAPAIEITFGQFSTQFHQDTSIAICGADLNATLNQKTISPWQTYFIRKGDQLTFSSPKSGLRAYLAVKGGFLVKPHLSSCSTVVRESLGGLNKKGMALSLHDRIHYQANSEIVNRHVPNHFIPNYSNELLLRFLPNKTVTGAGQQAIEQFASQTFQVSQKIDRMGYRLEGKAINVNSQGIISQGIALGAIQLPPNGQPIIMMKDKQTMGGYPLLGNLAYLDVGKLAQCAPGTSVSFTPSTIEALEKELVTYKNFFRVSY